MAQLFFPPVFPDLPAQQPVLFLAGSIEQGQALDWQMQIAQALADTPWAIFNPRRPQWDSSWENTLENPLFVEQVEWELQALERANTVFFHFQPNTLSPISLLELGLCAQSNKQIIVHCPQGFWRKGNVDVVCRRYGLQLVADWSQALALLQT